MSKFDVILIIVAVGILSACIADFWLITHGFPEFGAGFWSVILGVSGGEVVTFSIYRMVKKSTESKLPKALTAKHALIDELEQEEQDEPGK